MDLRDQYKAKTLRILGKFQMLEFGLKHYIGFSYKLIHKKLDGVIHFGHSLQDVENLPLGRLLTLFAKLNSNTELHKQLRSLLAKRNHVAHKSLLVSAGSSYDIAALEKADEEFFYLEDEVHECLNSVLAELRQLKEKLYGPEA